ncbi:IQ domain-containing protein F3 [Artibeus jamaicensis]|uniref:IQ domain-containing protein F3 n=1 Tax=Artibeus jamaicensis TaxID=9417 RepID=UPI00235A89B1|nr:IQ domain-containing protein F3 [Artibeus jamaicensis]
MGVACCRLLPELEPPERRQDKKVKWERPREKVPRTKAEAAGRIQAWWRGTLVRRTLLVAALRAWMIQAWWRALLRQRVRKFHQALLKVYVIQEQAAVKLQSYIRRCQCHQRYSQGRGAVSLLQAPRPCLPLQTRGRLQAQPEGTTKGLEFHVEILSI